MLKYKSKIGRGSSKFSSQRVIIPKEITKILETSPGDYIEWNVNIDGDGLTVTVTKKIEKNDKN